MDPKAAICCKACGTPIDTGANRGDAASTCPQCGATLTIFTEETVAPESPVRPVPGDARLSDLQVPGYEIRRQIGRGGMGFVFEARQESLNRSVAIKVLAPHLGNDPQFVARFEAEAAALARVAHPSIVSIYERGRCGDRLYFVMEFVAGDGQGRPLDLKSVLARGPLANGEARRLIVQVMRALSVAHAEGIVHRDVKPGNILLDRHGNVKVADFGIAWFDDVEERERLTRPAAAMGTYDYMAPEQRADAASVDSRADVYSTAVMLYEMLTGRIPAGAWMAPSTVRPGVHASWDAVIARGMHPQRGDRYPTMAAFLADVEAISFDASSPITASPPPGAGRESCRCCACRQPVRDDAQFCPACREPQFLDCGACGTRMRAALNGCEQCGADLQRQRSYERFAALGTAALERARNDEAPASRIHAAQEAGMMLARARKAAADPSTVAALLAEANQIVETCALRAATEAIKVNHLGEAAIWLEAVLDVAPHHAEANPLWEKLAAERESGITEAKRLRDTGRPHEAVRVLGELAKAYADDAMIAEVLHDCERRASALETVVHETIPALMAERKLCAVEAIVGQLRAENAQVASLDDLAHRVEVILRGTGSVLSKAELAMKAGHFEAAGLAADAILARVADHPRAIELRDLAGKSLDDVRDATNRLRAALEERRWFVARHVGGGIPASMRPKPAIATLLRQTDAGIERANRHATVVCIAMAGALAMIEWAWLAGWIKDRLETMLAHARFGVGFLGDGWLTTGSLLTVTGWLGVAAVVGTSVAIGRPVRTGSIVSAVTVLPVSCLVAMFIGAQHSWDADMERRLSDLLADVTNPHSLEDLRARVANFVLWLGYAAALAQCLAGIRGPSKTGVGSTALVAGLAATATAFAFDWSEMGRPSCLGIALLFASFASLAGRLTGPVHVMAVVGTGLLVAGGSVAYQDRVWWLPAAVVALALVASQAILARPPTLAGWIADAVLVLAAVLAAILLHSRLMPATNGFPAITPAAILVANFLAAGLVAARWTDRDEIDRRLHLADRFLTGAWFIGPSSGLQHRRPESRP